MKKFITCLFILCAISVAAHEFWLQPDKFIYKKGEKATIRFQVGENFEGENWKGNQSKIIILSLFQNNIKKDLTSLLSSNNGDSLQLILPREGTSLIAFNGINSFIQLEATKFNEYLKEDGLKEAIEYRKQHNETEDSSREFYQRSVKTVLQVDNKYDDTYKQATNLPVDIIPQSHPYKLKNGEVISFKILFQQKPLANHLIKLWHRINNKTIFTEKLSDKKGLVNFQITTSGKWMISTVQMIRLQNEPQSQWQSYWGSCTWGYE